MLSALLRARITSTKRVRPRHLWVLCPEDSEAATPTSSRVRYAQEFYSLENFPERIADFSALAAPALAEIPHDDYYSPQFSLRERGDKLSVPSTLSELLDAFTGLSADDRSRFLRATQWFHASEELWRVQTSSGYTALVSAIETLMPKATGSPVCTTCGKETGPGPTRRFREFVDGLLPASDSYATSRGRLYEIRSAHWGTLEKQGLTGHPKGREAAERRSGGSPRRAPLAGRETAHKRPAPSVRPGDPDRPQGNAPTTAKAWSAEQ